MTDRNIATLTVPPLTAAPGDLVVGTKNGAAANFPAGPSWAQLGDVGGANILGFDWAQLYATNTGGWALQTASNAFHIFRLIPVSEWAAIIAGTSTFDGTGVINSALANNAKVFIPAGTFWGTAFVNPGNRLETAGFKTIFRQLPGQPVGTRLINLTRSNFYLGDCTVYGNIASDTDEQSHSIFCRPDATSGDIVNGEIGTIRGFDVRGDVVYLGQPNGAAQKLSNIRVGFVYGDNIYRNVVSIVSGNAIKVAGVSGPRVGLFAIDVESNATSGPCTNIEVGYVKGRSVGIIGTTPADYVDGVRFDSLELNPSFAARSDPIYPYGVANSKDGVTVRNAKYVHIGYANIEAVERCAVFVVFNVGELGCETLEIDNLVVNNCSTADAVYNAYVICGAPSKIKIGRLSGSVVGAGKSVFSAVTNSVIGSLNIDLTTATSRLFNSCANISVAQTVVTGAGRVINNGTKIALRNGTVACAFFAAGQADGVFENLDVTATTVFTSGQERCTLINTTLNGAYTALGNGVRPYVAPRKVTGTTSATPNTGVAFAHGLGYVPTQVNISERATGQVYQSAPPDATSVFLASATASVPFDVYAV